MLFECNSNTKKINQINAWSHVSHLNILVQCIIALEPEGWSEQFEDRMAPSDF